VLKHLEKAGGDGTFDEDAVRVLVAAFDAAWQAVQESGASFASNGQAEATRELLALRIIEVAQSTGVRDHIHLRDDALLYLTQSNRSSSGC
jgi:aspartate oxidase